MDFEPTKDWQRHFEEVRNHNRDNSPLSEWIAYGFDITVLLVTERVSLYLISEALREWRIIPYKERRLHLRRGCVVPKECVEPSFKKNKRF